MKILYGVQGTGNGHISRARVVARQFQEAGADVDYLFSGRPKEDFFDMEVFGDCMYRRGLTFQTENGKTLYGKTLLKNSLTRLAWDILQLDTSSYDYIITDFEPITAWAGKLRNLPVIGIGHQYAFEHPVPCDGETALARNIMKYFAPAKNSFGLHWHHFNCNILPPIIDTSIQRHTPKDTKTILVYLPFENQDYVQSLLREIRGYRFVLYAPSLQNQDAGHISLRKNSLQGFKEDLESAQGVICNSGFELISECLHLGLPVLTKPLQKQMEQLSNAEALRHLDFATTSQELSQEIIQSWLNKDIRRHSIQYPDVAGSLVKWLLDDRREQPDTLTKRLWEQVGYS